MVLQLSNVLCRLAPAAVAAQRWLAQLAGAAQLMDDLQRRHGMATSWRITTETPHPLKIVGTGHSHNRPGAQAGLLEARDASSVTTWPLACRSKQRQARPAAAAEKNQGAAA